MRLLIAALTGVVALSAATVALADPGGRSTLSETIRPTGSGYRTLVPGPGQPYLIRKSGLGSPKSGRDKRRSSLLFFAQFTDPQLADEMSPARVEVLDPAGGVVSAAWRPQEAMGAYVFDQTVRNVNRNRTSPVKQGNGRRRALDFGVLTGDLPDNQQLNESKWYIQILRGGRVDPFSGRSPKGCGLDAATTARLQAAVDGRRYTGVQDYNDYPGLLAERYQGFWDPDVAVPGGAGFYAPYPRYPGLMDRAQSAFTAEGLKVPWFTTRGNHDGLIQGNVPASSPLLRSLAVGCTKPFPDNGFDPASLRGKSAAQIFGALEKLVPQLIAGAKPVPPDPNRRFVSKPEYKKLHGTGVAHGYGYVDPNEQKASRGTASYYDFSPKPGFRFVGLDSVAEGGGADGNLDDPQYKWLAKVLDANSSVEYDSKGRLVRDKDPDRLIVVFDHHTLATMDNATPDEDAGCTDPNGAGCDGDPRNSRPLHLGVTGNANVRDLLLKYPNVVAFVTGHTHRNAVGAFPRPDGKSGFWQINTASHVDYPQQSRLLEVMDNKDGTLSLFGTILDTAAPIKPPPPGTSARSFTPAQMASISRQLSFSDPQRKDDTNGDGPGTRTDRNVEMLIKDPRVLWRK